MILVSSGIFPSIPEFHCILRVFLRQTLLKSDEVHVHVGYFIWPAWVVFVNNPPKSPGEDSQLARTGPCGNPENHVNDVWLGPGHELVPRVLAMSSCG